MPTSGQLRRMTPVLMALTLAACGGGGSPPPPPPPQPQPPAGSTITPEPNPQPAASQTKLQILSKPFAGEFPMGNYFDHDSPGGPGSSSGGYQITWRGQHAIPCSTSGGARPCVGYDGHNGYDWALPEGTPLLAATDGLVILAGPGQSKPCPLMNNEFKQSLVLEIAVRAPDGNIYAVLYDHVGRVDVAVNDRVVAGQQIGLSGSTGCVGYSSPGLPWPHLHFMIYAVDRGPNSSDPPTDPYGWEGPGIDPWKANPAGVDNVWLWKDGQAPSLVLP